MFKDPDLLATMLSKGRTEKEESLYASRIARLLSEKGFLSAVQTTRRGAPSVVRETEGVLTEEDPRLPAPAPSPAPAPAPAPTPAPAAVPDTRQGSLSLPRPVTPTTRAAAAPSPVPASAPNISPTPQPVDRTRFAAMFPNDMASGMINSGQGIGSLL